MNITLKDLYKSAILFLIALILLLLASCGPMVMTAGVYEPPPPWFYPNRLEVVRYVYFPDYRFYYDLSARTYVYLDGGVWVRRKILPPRYRNLNLRRSRYERVKGYRNDDIREYHEKNNANRGRSNRNTPRSNRNTTRRSG
ncbi:hypothetical protein [Maribacter aestuarii]|uniref:hypothetical protein n=1 Tax=Maribacter aestuarii TaxID=1130723 RepID=UPI00248B2A2F|nr:hypothetical protein [Maribacter aestuarii]